MKIQNIRSTLLVLAIALAVPAQGHEGKLSNLTGCHSGSEKYPHWHKEGLTTVGGVCVSVIQIAQASWFELALEGMDEESLGEMAETFPGIYRLDGAGDCAIWRIPVSLVTTVRRQAESVGKLAEFDEEFEKEGRIREIALLLEQCLQDAGSTDDYTLDRPNDHTLDRLMD